MGKPRSDFLSALGILFQVFKAVADDVLAAGGDDNDIRRIQTDADLRRAIVGLIVSSRLKVTTPMVAKQIMGTNFFGLEEAEKYFGLKPTEEQAKLFVAIPFSEQVLREKSKTHVLVAVLPISILEIWAKYGELFYGQDWYNAEAFASEKVMPGWYLVRKDVVVGTLGKYYQSQLALVPVGEEVADPTVMVYTVIGFFKATGERLFGKVWARTAKLSSGGGRVHVGFFDANGLDIDRWGGNNPNDNVGLASSEIQSQKS